MKALSDHSPRDVPLAASDVPPLAASAVPPAGSDVPPLADAASATATHAAPAAPEPAEPVVVEGDGGVERARLLEAIRGRTLHVALQPIARLDSGEVAGFAAFARFAGEPQRSPHAWFHAADQAGLRCELECAAIRRALAYLHLFPRDTFLAVKAAPGTLLSSELPLLLTPAVRDRLVVELTAHGELDDYAALTEAVGLLRARGARLALDDTGAGLASLRRIMSLEPDFIKLDPQLTRDIDRDPTGQALASTLVALAGRIGARVIAEGIETGAELRTLASSGVPLGQGYLLSRPQVPTDDRLELPRGIALPAGDGEQRERVSLPRLQDQLARARGFRDAVRAAVRSLADELPDCTVVVEQLDHGARVTRVVDAVVRGAPIERGLALPFEGAPSYQMSVGRGPRICNDVPADPTYGGLAGCRRLGVGSYAGVPLASADAGAIGALSVLSADAERFSPAQLELLEAVAAMLVERLLREVPAGERWRIGSVLRAHAMHDDLTGLLNPDSFVEAAGRASRLAGRRRGGRYVVVVEVADLARLAGLHGLAVRDLVLKDVVTALISALGAADLVGRVAEDRFAALLVARTHSESPGWFCSQVAGTLDDLAHKREVRPEVRASIHRLERSDDLLAALRVDAGEGFRLTARR